MQSTIPSFAQIPAGNPQNLYPGQDNQQEEKPILCCGSSTPLLFFKPVKKLRYPHDGLIQDLIQDLMGENRNFERQQHLASQNTRVTLPIPPFIPSKFNYIVEVTTRVPHVRKVKLPQEYSSFGGKAEIGYPSMILESHKPYRWFVLSNENAFHASQVHKDLTRISDGSLVNLVASQTQKNSIRQVGNSSSGQSDTLEVMSCDPVANTYVPHNEILNDAKVCHQFGCQIPIRLKEKHQISDVTKSDSFTPGAEQEYPAARKQTIPAPSTIPEMEKRTWVEIGQDDVPELFDNTKREYTGGLVLKYRCGRVDCPGSPGTEWTFQVLERVVVRKTRWSMPTHIRYSRAAPNNSCFADYVPKAGRSFSAPTMRQVQRVESGHMGKADVKLEVRLGLKRDEDEDEMECSSEEDESESELMEDDSMDVAFGDDPACENDGSEDSEEYYHGRW